MSGCRDLRALRIRHFTAQGVVKGVQKGWGYTSGGLWQRGPAAGAKGSLWGSQGDKPGCVLPPELPRPDYGP